MKRMLALLAAIAMSACSARGIEIENVWARATPPGSTAAAVYADVRAGEADEIVAVTSPLAERVEIHRSSETGGTMQMRPVASVALSRNDTVRFETGGLHLMLIGLREPLSAGSSIPLTFSFRSASPITVNAQIVAPGDDPHAH
jgi:periplasmic copper chaperone A